MERIIVKNVSKKFKIGYKKRQGALEKFISVFSGREPRRSFWALKNISFTARAGEIMGIIGENGSGKSTLLRIIAGIYDRDKGTVETNGKIVSMIGLYAGLQPRLTMKDNIYLCCSLFDLDQQTIKKRFTTIVKFSELEDFVDTKVYQFSTGMLRRLAFSIAIHSNPEVLLLDEVFEIGDESFKKKSSSKISEFVKGGAMALLVSHDLEMIKKYCHKVIWLEKGKIRAQGLPKKVTKRYIKETSRQNITQ